MEPACLPAGAGGRRDLMKSLVRLLRPSGARRRDGGRSEWAQIETDIGPAGGRACLPVFGLCGSYEGWAHRVPVTLRPIFNWIGEGVPFVLRGGALPPPFFRRWTPPGRGKPSRDQATQSPAPTPKRDFPLHQVTRDLTPTETLRSNDAALHLLRWC